MEAVARPFLWVDQIGGEDVCPEDIPLGNWCLRLGAVNNKCQPATNTKGRVRNVFVALPGKKWWRTK